MSLLKKQRPKRIAIKEVNDLNTLLIDYLIDLLISYEKDLVIEKEDKDKKNQSIALKAS